MDTYNTYIPDDEAVVFESSVDFEKMGHRGNLIHFTQYDHILPVLEIKMMMNGEKFILPENAQLRFRFGKHDETFVYTNPLGLDESRSVVYFAMDNNITEFPGVYKPVIELIYPLEGSIIPSSVNNPRISSSPLAVKIDCNPVQESYIQSVVEYTDLDEAVQSAKKSAEEAKQAAQTVDGMVYITSEEGVIPQEKLDILKNYANTKIVYNSSVYRLNMIDGNKYTYYSRIQNGNPGDALLGRMIHLDISTGEYIHELMDNRLGVHMLDKDVHVSQQDRDRWDNKVSAEVDINETLILYK